MKQKDIIKLIDTIVLNKEMYSLLYYDNNTINDIEYYIKNISRIAKRFYNDNHFIETQGREPFDKYCNKYLNNFNIIYKQITPINYLYPPILKINKVSFEEVLRIKNS